MAAVNDQPRSPGNDIVAGDLPVNEAKPLQLELGQVVSPLAQIILEAKKRVNINRFQWGKNFETGKKKERKKEKRINYILTGKNKGQKIMLHEKILAYEGEKCPCPMVWRTYRPIGTLKKYGWKDFLKLFN